MLKEGSKMPVEATKDQKSTGRPVSKKLEKKKDVIEEIELDPVRSDQYVKMVYENYVFEKLHFQYPESFLFQQDNASSHTEGNTKRLFEVKGIVFLKDSPLRSQPN